MILDARNFEKLLANTAGGRKSFKYQGNGILLNLEDVRTFGGVYRFYRDAKGNPTSPRPIIPTLAFLLTILSVNLRIDILAMHLSSA